MGNDRLMASPVLVIEALFPVREPPSARPRAKPSAGLHGDAK